MLAKVAVYSTTRSIEYAFGAGPSHRFDDVVGKKSSLIEIDFRLPSSARYIRIGRQMDHDVVTFHRGAQLVELGNIATNDAKARIAKVLLIVPFATRRQIVVQSYPCNIWV